MTPSACTVATGCPIRTSQDQSLFDGSPGLIAAYHVLLRLVTPRHSPCTLNSLTAFVVDPQTNKGRQTDVKPIWHIEISVFAFPEKKHSFGYTLSSCQRALSLASPIGLPAASSFPPGPVKHCCFTIPNRVKLCTAFRPNRQLNSWHFPEKFQLAHRNSSGIACF